MGGRMRRHHFDGDTAAVRVPKKGIGAFNVLMDVFYDPCDVIVIDPRVLRLRSFPKSRKIRGQNGDIRVLKSPSKLIE